MGNEQSKRGTASGNEQSMSATVSGDPDPRAGHESVVVNNKLLVWGGGWLNKDTHLWKFSPRCDCFAMDLHSQKWHQTIAIADSREDEPPPCLDARCAVIDNSVYSFGGYKGNDVYLNDMFCLDCNKMKWKKLEIKGSKPTARSACGLCAAEEKLVMFGGLIAHEDRGTLPEGAKYKQRDPLWGYVNDCWEFCSHEVSWTPLVTLGSSPSPRCGHSLTAVTPLRIVLYGGRNPDCLSDIHVLDCEDGMWRWKEVKCSAMWPTGRALHSTCCVSPSLCVVIGGFMKGGDLDGNAYVVDIERGNAHRISVGDARAGHTACCRVASDGSALIFVFGGTRDNFSDMKSVISGFRVYSCDPQSPFAISVCHNPAERLQHDIVMLSMQQKAAPAESSDEPSAASSAHLSVGKETEREEVIRTVAVDDVLDKEERSESNNCLNH